jgi:hypothetical protein
MQLYRGTIGHPIVFEESAIITLENLDSIDFDKVIYGEISPKGAMGNEGGILLYVLGSEDKLTTYEANLEIDAPIFSAVSERIDQNANLFTGHYGGMGNHVFIKKDIQLDIDEKYGCFWYHAQNTKLRIDSSVKGVFESVVAEMKQEKTK